MHSPWGQPILQLYHHALTALPENCAAKEIVFICACHIQTYIGGGLPQAAVVGDLFFRIQSLRLQDAYVNASLSWCRLRPETCATLRFGSMLYNSMQHNYLRSSARFHICRLNSRSSRTYRHPALDEPRVPTASLQ